MFNFAKDTFMETYTRDGYPPGLAETVYICPECGRELDYYDRIYRDRKRREVIGCDRCVDNWIPAGAVLQGVVLK